MKGKLHKKGKNRRREETTFPSSFDAKLEEEENAREVRGTGKRIGIIGLSSVAIEEGGREIEVQPKSERKSFCRVSPRRRNKPGGKDHSGKRKEKKSEKGLEETKLKGGKSLRTKDWARGRVKPSSS